MRTDIYVAYRRPTGNTSSQKAAVVTQWRRSQPRAAFVRGRARVVVVCVRACVRACVCACVHVRGDVVREVEGAVCVVGHVLGHRPIGAALDTRGADLVGLAVVVWPVARESAGGVWGVDVMAGKRGVYTLWVNY